MYQYEPISQLRINATFFHSIFTMAYTLYFFHSIFSMVQYSLYFFLLKFTIVYTLYFFHSIFTKVSTLYCRWKRSAVNMAKSRKLWSTKKLRVKLMTLKSASRYSVSSTNLPVIRHLINIDLVSIFYSSTNSILALLYNKLAISPIILAKYTYTYNTFSTCYTHNTFPIYFMVILWSWWLRWCRVKKI